MDPNLFHLDWERTFEVLGAIVVLSFFLERALAMLFEHRWFIRRFAKKGVKEPLSYALALAVVLYLDFDALSMIVLQEKTALPGYLLTAGVIAGGSKGAVKLFHDVLDWKSTAYRAAQAEDAKP
jgi:hypothetical protein